MEVVRRWTSHVPDDFRFSPKFPRIITHDKRLADCAEELGAFLDAMDVMGAKLGPLVLQFDYTFRYDQRENLYDFLKNIPPEYRVAVEVRSRDWFQPEFFSNLSKFNTALVLHDLYYMPRRTEVTADFTYIRLLGNRKQIPDDFSHPRIERKSDFEWWAERVHDFLSRGVEVFVFINNRYQGHAPASVRAFLDVFNPG